MEHSHVTAHTVAIKLRYANFHTITRQASLKTPTGDAATIADMASQLLDNVIEPGDEFRLLGIQCSRLSETGAQAQLWGDSDTKAQA
jgi:DNA polymerase-4